MYPDDATLIARGKLSTLSAERREQLKRVAATCDTVVRAAHQFLRDCEDMPPEDLTHIITLERCLTNMRDARERIVNLAGEMIELKPIAWPQ
jgi:hypothetical protein